MSPDDDLFVTRSGHGPPLLVMHGGLGLDHTYLRSALDPFADDYELIYYDHRGNGRSSRDVDYELLTHDAWCDDASRIVRELSLSGIVLFGHSYGGFLALEYAARYPDSVARLILCNTAPAMDYAPTLVEGAKAKCTPDQFDILMSALSGDVREDEAFRAGWLQLLPAYFHHFKPDYAATIDRETRYSARAFNRGNRGCLPGYDVTQQLSKLTMPSLVLTGQHDWFAPVDQAARLARALPQSTLVVFESSGHFPFYEEAAGFQEALRHWLYSTAPE